MRLRKMLNSPSTRDDSECPKQQKAEARRPRFGFFKPAIWPSASVTRPRIGLHILAVRIAVVAIALREIIARP